MILYVTYNDQPSGVYWSQVTDVVEHLNSLGKERVRLVAIVSIRDYFHSSREIRARSEGAWVVPMMPRAHNWRINWIWLAIIARITGAQGVIGRGVFATAMALRLRDRGRVKYVCYDGRGAYGMEWKEYRVVDDDDLIAQCQRIEAEAVNRADMRLAVSHALVDHWRDHYGYTGQDHVVIPCTIGTEPPATATPHTEGLRARLGWATDARVLVYSGGTGGWQSLGLLARVLERVLRADPQARILFLSGPDGHIDHLIQRFPGRVVREWLPHEEVHQALAQCDIGLLVRERSVTNEVASPTKFAEYLHAGLPVLISEHIGDLATLVRKHRLGWIEHAGVEAQMERPSPEEKVRIQGVAKELFSKSAYDEQYATILKRLQEEGIPTATAAPLISIVVPSFNKSRYITEMVDSVRAQSYPNWELLFIDDASTDGTQEIMTGIARAESRIRMHFLPVNRGANHCRNLGIQQAAGKYVIFLDADDLLGEHCLRDRLRVAEQEDLDLCVFTMEVFRGSKGDSTHRWIPSSSDPLADFFRHKLPWSVMQPIWRRAFLQRIGGFDESFKRHQDVEFHTRALLEPGVRYRTVVGEPDCFYRISEERKVLKPYELLDGFTESSLGYHAKFLQKATELGRRSMILGIIYQTYMQILLNFKNRVIGKEEFQTLENKLFGPSVRDEMGLRHRLLFRIARTYNLLPIRVPGINMVLYRAITG